MFRFQGNLKKKGLPIESKTWEIEYQDMEFLKTLGKGSFGTVFHGMYFGTDVAIKQINDDDEKYLEREVAILKDIRHPNIVQLMGICEHQTGLYLVTELLNGGTLRKKLKNKAVEMGWPLRLDVTIQMARALTYLHSKDIIHRDLKSKNVLVDEHFKIKICDFGLARTVENDGIARRMTICGTEDWIPPEVAQGHPYDDRADVFSFGIVMLEIIFRQKPNQDCIRHNVSRGVDMIHAKQRLPRDTPSSYASLTFRCCSYDMEGRPSIAIVLKELKALQPELAGTQEQTQPTQKPTPSPAPPQQTSAPPSATPPPPPPPPPPPASSFRSATPVQPASCAEPGAVSTDEADQNLIMMALHNPSVSSRRGNTLREPLEWTTFGPPSPKTAAESVSQAAPVPSVQVIPPMQPKARAAKPRPLGAPPPRPQSMDMSGVAPVVTAAVDASPRPVQPKARVQESFRVHSPKVDQSFEIFVNPLNSNPSQEITAQDLEGAPVPDATPVAASAKAGDAKPQTPTGTPKISFVKRMFGKSKPS